MGALLTKVRTAGISRNLTFPSSATGGGQVRFCHRQRSDSITPFKIGVIHRKKLESLVFHGISRSLYPPLAAVALNNSVRLTRLAHKSSRSIETHRISRSLHPPLAVVALNNSVQNRRDSSQKARITSFSRNFALPLSATGGGCAQFILD